MPKSAPDGCCAVSVTETTSEHEHRPAPCPLRWCCENGEFTPILQQTPSLSQRADESGDQRPNILLALDAILEEQQARRFVSEASPPKPPPAAVWLSNSSLLI